MSQLEYFGPVGPNISDIFGPNISDVLVWPDKIFLIYLVQPDQKRLKFRSDRTKYFVTDQIIRLLFGLPNYLVRPLVG